MSALDIMIVILFLVWLGGLTRRVGGKFIHFLLIIALGMLFFRVIGRGGGGGNRMGPDVLFGSHGGK